MSGMKHKVFFLIFLLGSTNGSLNAKVSVLNFQETCAFSATLAGCSIGVSALVRSGLKVSGKIPQDSQNFSYLINTISLIGFASLVYGAHNKSDFFDDKLKNNERQLQLIKIGSIIAGMFIIADSLWQTMQKHGD